MRTLVRWFIQGLIVLLPIVTTIYVLTRAFDWIDSKMQAQMAGQEHGLGHALSTPGLGVLFAVLIATLVGWLSSLVLGKWIVRVTDWVVGRIPLVSTLYGIVKDILRAVGGQNKSFDRPVVITLFPGGTTKILGFITRDDLAAIGLPGEVAVLLQQSLNFAGNLVIVPKDQVRALPIDAGAFMTFVMSGGLTGELSATPKKESFPAIE